MGVESKPRSIEIDFFETQDQPKLDLTRGIVDRSILNQATVRQWSLTDIFS